MTHFSCCGGFSNIEKNKLRHIRSENGCTIFEMRMVEVIFLVVIVGVGGEVFAEVGHALPVGLHQTWNLIRFGIWHLVVWKKCSGINPLTKATNNLKTWKPLVRVIVDKRWLANKLNTAINCDSTGWGVQHSTVDSILASRPSRTGIESCLWSFFKSKISNNTALIDSPLLIQWKA